VVGYFETGFFLYEILKTIEKIFRKFDNLTAAVTYQVVVMMFTFIDELVTNHTITKNDFSEKAYLR